jgi:hypothetical protein
MRIGKEACNVLLAQALTEEYILKVKRLDSIPANAAEHAASPT